MPTYTFTIKSDNEQVSAAKKYSYGYRGSTAIVPDPMPTETDSSEIEVTNSNPKIKYKRTSGVGISLQSTERDVKVPFDVYVLDTEKSAFASLEEFYKQNPPTSSATSESTLQDFDSKFKPAIVELVKDIVISVPAGAMMGGFLAKGGKYDIIARRAAIEIEYGQKVNFGKTFAQRNAEMGTGVDKTREETSLATLRETPVLAKINTAIDDSESSVASFLVGGKQSKYTEGTPEAILYGNFLAFCDMYGVKEPVEKKIDEKVKSVPPAAEEPVEPAAPPAPPTAPTEAMPDEPGDAKTIREKIAQTLTDSLIKELSAQGDKKEKAWLGLQMSDFGPDKDINKLLTKAVDDIKTGTAVAFTSAKAEQLETFKDPENINTAGRKGGEATVLGD